MEVIMTDAGTAPATATDSKRLEIDLNLKIGEQDSSGRKVRFIHTKEPNYIIYETLEGQVVVQGAVALANHPEINMLLSQIADLLTNTPALKKKYNSSRAHGMKVFLEGDADSAFQVFTHLVSDIKRYLTRRARISYQAGAAACMLLSLVCLPIGRSFGDLNNLGARVCYAIIFSAMGGLLSVAIGAGKLKIDLQDNIVVNALYGAFRILIAMISGVLVVFLIEGKFVLSFLKDTPNPGGFGIASFVAGFSEKLIPNMLHGMEQDKRQKSP
jgi:hypothetical protein